MPLLGPSMRRVDLVYTLEKAINFGLCYKEKNNLWQTANSSHIIVQLFNQHKTHANSLFLYTLVAI